ncbi:type 2 periplasmic-binding domain-containing protein [Gluconobacter wancherniae]|uniref:hypothetical protein n=1 Tax=Gluconobacter wancherniae TaxID=1307955 RepID=UPI001B8C0F74|nr:hypothetical protein [Gluconobacter wancherniae]MBS1095796.1 hypothetical protein [Gluconobacter wancherniae]
MKVRIEFNIENDYINIISVRFDTDVRLGEIIVQDIIAVTIGPDLRIAAVASSDYIAEYGSPKTT